MSKKKEAILANFEGFDFGNEGNPTEFIPTGHSELDFIISRGLLNNENNAKSEMKTGGLPVGKMVMIYGGEGGGKSSLAYRICGSAQRKGKIPIWIDAENSFSETLAVVNGVDLSRMGRKQMFDKNDPSKIFDGERVLDCVMEAIKLGAGVVVLDSIGSLVPRYVMENDADKDTMAALARLLGKTVNKIGSLAAAYGALVVFINQLRVTPGVMFKDPEAFPGGKAIAHACSVILKLNKVNAKDGFTYIQDDEGNQKLIAGAANCFIQKNRFAAPHFGGIRIPIYYEHYFPEIEEVIFEAGRNTKTISVRSGVFTWDGIKVAGKKEFIAELIKKNKVAAIVEDIKKAASDNEDIVLPTEIINYDKHVAFAKDNKDKLEKAKVIANAKKTKEEEVNDIIGTVAVDTNVI